MTYRLLNQSRLSDDTAVELVEFAISNSPTIEKTIAIKLRDGEFPSGHAGPGALRKWAGRAAYFVTTTVPGEGWDVLGAARVCWHSAQLHQYANGRHREHKTEEHVAAWTQAVEDTYQWIEASAAEGATHIGRWPIFRTHTVEEAVVHTLAHELMHVLAVDRGRGKQSELLCEEHALRVLLAYQKIEQEKSCLTS